MTTDAWWESAACLNQWELFDDADRTPDAMAAAKAVCAGCDVLGACRDDAIRTEPANRQYTYSVRAGWTPEELVTAIAGKQPADGFCLTCGDPVFRRRYCPPCGWVRKLQRDQASKARRKAVAS